MAKYFVNVSGVEFIDVDGNTVYKHTKEVNPRNIIPSITKDHCKGCSCDNNKEEYINCCYCDNGHLYTKKSESE